MTNGELVSRVINDTRSITKDTHISRRNIIRIAKSKAKYYMAQKLGSNELFRENNLFTTISCFSMESDNLVKCDVIEFRKCSSLMKSVNKLPEMVFSRFGDSIVSVTSLDGSTDFSPVQATQYKASKSRLYGSFVNQNYYYVSDGYLYLPDSEIESVNVVIMTTSPEEAEAVSGCSDCEDECKSYWDYEFICSDKVEEIVITETLNEILSTIYRITPDENPNLDENQKTRTIQ